MRLLSIALIGGLILAAATASAKDTGNIFVSNEKSHEVWVFAPGTLEIVKKIKTSRRPRHMEFNSAHTLLYVACGDDDVIDVIDVASLEVVDQIPTSPSPEAFKISRDDRLIYVSNEEDSTVSVIDIAEKIIIHDIPTGAEPEGIWVPRDETRFYATSEVADMVHVIDAEGGFVTDNIIVGTRPRRFWMPPDEHELWVSAELSSEVYIIDAQTLQVTDVLTFLPPGFRQVDVTPVGLLMDAAGETAVIALGRANHIAFVNVATREIEDYVLVGSRAWNVSLSRDEATLYVTNGLSDDMTVVDFKARKALRSVPTGRVPYAVRIDD